MEQTLDVKALENLLQDIKQKKTRLIYKNVTSPSPFAHSLLITTQYRTNHQMGRERRAHLLRLHQEVLKEVLSTEQLAQLLDRRALRNWRNGCLTDPKHIRPATGMNWPRLSMTWGIFPLPGGP